MDILIIKNKQHFLKDNKVLLIYINMLKYVQIVLLFIIWFQSILIKTFKKKLQVIFYLKLLIEWK
jgi:hypothetical protein